jgi:hypothetical protein
MEKIVTHAFSPISGMPKHLNVNHALIKQFSALKAKNA